MDTKYLSFGQIDAYFINIKEALINRFHSTSSNNVKKQCENLIKGGTNLMNLKNYSATRYNDYFYSNNNFLGNFYLKDLIKKGQTIYSNSFEKILTLDEYKRLYMMCNKDLSTFKEKIKKVISRKNLGNPASLKFLEDALVDLSIKDEARISKVEAKYRNIEGKITDKAKELIIENLLNLYKRTEKRMPLTDEQYSAMMKIEELIDNFSNNNDNNGGHYSELIKFAENLPHAPKIKERVGKKIALKNDGSDETI